MTPSCISVPTVCSAPLAQPHPEAGAARSTSRARGNGAMKFQLLGHIEVEDERGPVLLAGRQQRVLLAQLLLRANSPVPASVLTRRPDRLTEVDWACQKGLDKTRCM